VKWIILNKETIVTIMPGTARSFSGTHSGFFSR